MILLLTPFSQFYFSLTNIDFLLTVLKISGINMQNYTGEWKKAKKVKARQSEVIFSSHTFYFCTIVIFA